MDDNEATESGFPSDEPRSGGRSKPLVVVGIGASAGGLEALETLFSHVPADSGMAFVLVQHLSPHRPSIMAELLTRHAKIPVLEAADGARVEPNHVYAMAPNTSLTIHGGILRVMTPAEPTILRGPIDTFFRSLAEDQAGRAVCVVLSGAGSDGTLGLKAIKEHGGITVAQAPVSAKYDSMPLSAIATGLVDHILPVEEIAAKLVEHANYVTRLADANSSWTLHAQVSDLLPDICAILHRVTGHDFSRYKQSTLGRRIERRLQVHHMDSVGPYVTLLQQDRQEAELLFKDLLIGVTQFFRDPEAFAALEQLVIPRLFENRGREGPPVRVWVAGCASGEEAYSVTILLQEARSRLDLPPEVQVFATDLDEGAIEFARQGRYPPSTVEHVSQERRERYFIRQGDAYQVTKQIRDMCVFSVHDLVRDPPFSSLDLISCRNLLIYLEAELQKRLIPLFHYALRPGGWLFLGASEGMAGSPELFTTVDKKHRVFLSKSAVLRPPVAFPLTGVGQAPDRVAAPVLRRRDHVIESVGHAIERIMLEEHLPPCVVVNERAEIVYSIGETGLFLQQPTGAATLNIVDQARKGIRLSLRMAVRQAIKTGEVVVREDLAVKTPAGAQRVDVIVRPLPEAHQNHSVFAVIFKPSVRKSGERDRTAPPLADDTAIQALESELQSTRGELQSTLEELEASNEELKSSNEELLSINEEMQSANEELQTSKEEMQSINEELATVNAELNRKVEQLDSANADLQNLFRSTDIATLFLDRELRIKRFTPAATAIFHLIDGDIGRPIHDFGPRFAEGDFVADMRETLRTLATRERQIFLPETGRAYLLRILPSRTLDNVIDGVVVTFVDITAMKKAAQLVAASEETARAQAASLRAVLDATPAIIWISHDRESRHISGNRTAYEFLRTAPDAELSKTGPAPEKLAHFRVFKDGAELAGDDLPIQHVSLSGQPLFGDSIDVVFTDGSVRSLLGNVVPVLDAHGRPTGAVAAFLDVTDRKRGEEDLKAARQAAEQAQAAAEAASHAKDQFIAVLSHELRTPLTPVLAAASALGRSNPPPDVREHLEMIQRNVELEARLIDDLLDVARIERGQYALSKRTVELCKILRDAIEVCAPEMAAQKLDLSADIPEGPQVMEGDPARLEQVFWNLLNNAIKFTPSGGRISVRCRREGGDGVVEVADTGRGIAPDVLPHLLHAFQRGDRPPGGKIGGLGLGLSISKAIVELHGGGLSAYSDGVGKGATFVVRLPLSAGAEVGEPGGLPSSAPPETDRTRRQRILLVEDHEDTARLLRRLLEARGHEVDVASDIATALTLSGAKRFDLLVSDLGLPDGSGLDLMRGLRARGLKLPGIALSGYGRQEDIAESRSAGFVAHLTKPVDMPRLEEAIAAAGEADPPESGAEEA